MGRSSGVMITVKVPVRWDVMTERQKTRLSRITSRDTRVIKAYLGVIERHEKELLIGKRKKRIDAGQLDKLTLRTKDRPIVLHDFKKRFRTISVNELQECRETAIAMWQVYLALGGKKPLRAKGYCSRKLPRHIFERIFDFVYTPEKKIKHWLIHRDSLDSVRQGRIKHDKLAIALSPSSYHLNQLKRGEMKSVQIIKDRDHKWWVLFKVKIKTEPIDTTGKPAAVLGIDLGIKKAVCSVLITKKGIKDNRYWTQKDKLARMERYDDIVSSLQTKKEELLQKGLSADDVIRALQRISSKRKRISFDYDRKLVRMLSEYIIDLSQRYDVHVAIGQLRGIRKRAKKGNGKGRRFRGMIHRWSFARITNALQHKLNISGFNPKHFKAVPEFWTSIKCHKCGSTGYRPKQSYFLCHTCGYRDNADRNAAINIGLRLIRLIPSLKNEAGLGNWLPPIRKTSPKTRRIRSKGMSLAPKRSPPSSERSTVADCYDQTSLSEFASSTDLAMEKTMEKPSATMESGEHGSTVQRTETQSMERSHTPLTHSKTHAYPVEEVLLVAGDSSHEEG